MTPSASPSPRILLLGLGNDILTDDAVGLHVVHELQRELVGVGETLALGRQLGLPMPEQVTIFAIEVEDPFTLGTTLTPALQAALPGIVDRIRAAVQSLL